MSMYRFLNMPSFQVLFIGDHLELGKFLRLAL